MVIIFRKGTNVQLSLLDANAAKLGLKPHAEYELIELSNGTFALVERTAKKNPLDAKIINRLKQSRLSERVEGKFEGLLNSEELKRFKELVKEGRIIPFKLSEKYKKAVYKLAEEIRETSEKIAEAARKYEEAQSLEKKREEQPPKRYIQTGRPINSITVPSVEEMKLAKHDYAIVRDDSVARTLSTRLSDEIRKREVFGTKTFDGEYYIIKKRLYDKYAPTILQFIKGHSSASADQIARELNIDKALVKVICEFLRERGDITERRKEVYEYIY